MDIVNKTKKYGAMVATIIGMLMLSYPLLGQSEESGFLPSLGVAYKHDDNIFRTETSEKSDDIYAISPGLSAKWLLGKHNLSAEYTGEYAYYDDYSAEDYKDHNLNAGLFLDLTPKFNFDLQTGTRRAHESRGSAGQTAGTSAFPHETEEDRVFAGLSYGRSSATAQIQLDIDTRDLRYTNNNQQERDRDTDALTGRVFYNVGEKTSLIVEAENRDIDYLNPGSRNRDSTERYYHLGLSWDATYKTTGEVKIGRFKKTFDSVSETDGSGTSVAASVVWEPQTYSQVTFGASRQANETTTTDSFYTSNVISVAWKHNFNPRLSLNADVSDGRDDYSGTREDDLRNMGAGLNYQLRPWLNLGGKISYAERKSNEADSSFEGNIFMLSATMSRQ